MVGEPSVEALSLKEDSFAAAGGREIVVMVTLVAVALGWAASARSRTCAPATLHTTEPTKLLNDDPKPLVDDATLLIDDDSRHLMGPVLGVELAEDPMISDTELIELMENAADEASIADADAYWSGDWKQPSLEQIKLAIGAGRSVCEAYDFSDAAMIAMDAEQRVRARLVVLHFGNGREGLIRWVDKHAAAGKADLEGAHLAYCSHAEAMAAWIQDGTVSW